MSEHALSMCQGLLDEANSLLNQIEMDPSDVIDPEEMLQEYYDTVADLHDECGQSQEVWDDIWEDLNPFDIKSDLWDLGVHSAACVQHYFDVADKWERYAEVNDRYIELQEQYDNQIAEYGDCLLDHLNR